MVILYGLIFLASLGVVKPVFSETITTPALQSIWQIDSLQHQNEARDIFHREKFLYVGQGGPEGKVAKIDIQSGKILWTYKTEQSYQPSYPVSNGHIVVFGTYYAAFDEKAHANLNYLVALDDQSGKFLWKIPVGTAMSGVVFSDQLAFVGNNDGDFYGIDWKKGEIFWKTKLGHYIWSTPCIYNDIVLVGSFDGYLYAVNQKTGQIQWQIDCGGMIGSNPIVANDLVFIVADTQAHLFTQYNSSKEQRVLKVINLKTKEVLESFETETRWNYKIISSGDDVYFFDYDHLYSYNTTSPHLNWKIKVSPQMAPYPIFYNSSIMMAMNYLGHHGEYVTGVLWIDRATGKELGRSATGGIGVRSSNYVQSDNVIVTTEWKLEAYKLGEFEH